MTSLRLDDNERRGYAEAGYLLRRAVFGQADLRALRGACEEVVADLMARSRGRRIRMGSYLFELELHRQTVIKWEVDQPDMLLGVEPLAHLHPVIQKYAEDPRLTEPMADAVGSDEVCLYTEKLNVKRARMGGPIALHQDYPYWADVADDARRIHTALIFLDDSDRGNGCLEVAPGSHLGGLQAERETGEADFARFEMDPAQFDSRRLLPLEVAAGGVVFLGSMLVHRSLPNPSSHDRRALLYSYQPAGSRHSREYIPIRSRQKSRGSSR